MTLLNKGMAYEAVATTESRKLFLGGSPLHHEPLFTGMRLCRFEPLASMGGCVCPWWLLYDDFALSNGQVIPGLGNYLVGSGCRVDPQRNLVAPPGVRLSCMEPGSRFAMVRLITSAYGYLGPTVPQRPEPCGGRLPLRGGELRVWIPGLEAGMVQPVAAPPDLFLSQPWCPEHRVEASEDTNRNPTAADDSEEPAASGGHAQ